MKHVSLLLVSAVLLLLYSCEKTVNGTADGSILKTDSLSLTLKNDSVTVDSFKITSNVDWVLHSPLAWVHVSAESGHGNATIYVKADNNTSATARTATIKLAAVGNSSLAVININVTQAAATPSGIVWQTAIGGSGLDQIYASCATQDGGLAVAGLSQSNNQDVSGAHGDNDAMVAKLDASGKKLWVKLFGGSKWDQANSIKATADGGFVVAGWTQSTDGDFANSHGQQDAWVMKLDAQGNTVWKKTYGEPNDDAANAVIVLADGSIVFSGYASQDGGDVTGVTPYDYSGDFWMVKLTSNGAIVWQKAEGTSSTEWSYALTASPDGGFVAAGLQANGGRQGRIVKFDGSGNTVWAKTYGGSNDENINSIVATPDGGYLLAGNTESFDGDISGNHGQVDAWVLKIDGSGNKVWSKVYGGSNIESAQNITATADGNYLFTGYTYSNDGNVTGVHGTSYGDAWVVKIDGTGALLWHKELGSTGQDNGFAITALNDGSFIMAGDAQSNDGDVSGLFTNGYSYRDGWVIKYKP